MWWSWSLWLQEGGETRDQEVPTEHDNPPDGDNHPLSAKIHSSSFKSWLDWILKIQFSIHSPICLHIYNIFQYWIFVYISFQIMEERSVLRSSKVISLMASYWYCYEANSYFLQYLWLRSLNPKVQLLSKMFKLKQNIFNLVQSF